MQEYKEKPIKRISGTEKIIKCKSKGTRDKKGLRTECIWSYGQIVYETD